MYFLKLVLTPTDKVSTFEWTYSGTRKNSKRSHRLRDWGNSVLSCSLKHRLQAKHPKHQARRGVRGGRERWSLFFSLANKLLWFSHISIRRALVMYAKWITFLLHPWWSDDLSFLRRITNWDECILREKFRLARKKKKKKIESSKLGVSQVFRLIVHFGKAEGEASFGGKKMFLQGNIRLLIYQRHVISPEKTSCSVERRTSRRENGNNISFLAANRSCHAATAFHFSRSESNSNLFSAILFQRY